MSGAVTASNRLPELADEINEAHAMTTVAFRNALDHAIRAGELLIEAKKAIGHGKWLPWLRDNCTVKERTAQLYMRLARERPKLVGANPQAIADFTITEAVAQITQQTARMARLPPLAIKQAFKEGNHTRLRIALKRAENWQRHEEWERRQVDAVDRDDVVLEREVDEVPTPKWSKDEERFLWKAGRLCSDFMEAHPEIGADHVCDMLNVVYCAVQDGHVHAESDDPLLDDEPIPDDDQRSPCQADVGAPDSVVANNDDANASDAGDKPAENRRPGAQDDANASAAPEDDPFYIPPFLDRRDGGTR